MVHLAALFSFLEMSKAAEVDQWCVVWGRINNNVGRNLCELTFLAGGP
jgi:hypothetical protein